MKIAEHELLKKIFDFYFFEKELNKEKNIKEYKAFIKCVKALEDE